MKKTYILIIIICLQFCAWYVADKFNPAVNPLQYALEVLDNRTPLVEGKKLQKTQKLVATDLHIDAPGVLFDILYDSLIGDTIIIDRLGSTDFEYIPLQYKLQNKSLHISMASIDIFKHNATKAKSNIFNRDLYGRESIEVFRIRILTNKISNLTIDPFTNASLYWSSKKIIDTMVLTLNEGAKMTMEYLNISNLKSSSACNSRLVFTASQIENLDHTSGGGIVSFGEFRNRNTNSVTRAVINQSKESNCSALISIKVSESLEANLHSYHPTKIIYNGNPKLKINLSNQNKVTKKYNFPENKIKQLDQ